MMHRPFIIIFLAISLLIVSCVKSNDLESDQNIEIEKQLSGEKVRINKSGKLSYIALSNATPEGSPPPISSVDSFLNNYTDSELDSINHFILVNSDRISGEIFAIESLKGIERLSNLQHVQISSSGLKDLSGIESLGGIQKISLQDNELTHIPNIGELTNLEYLGVQENPIVSVIDIKGNKNLKSISLDHTLIKDLDGIDHFSNLQHIRCISSELIDITGLENLENLKSLEIYSPKLNEESIALLKQMETNNSNIKWGIK